MSNSFYNHSSYPTPNAPGSSAALRAEFQRVTEGFNKLPTLAGAANQPVLVNSAGTALTTSTALAGLTLTGSTLDSTPVGATTPSTGQFTDLAATGAVNLGSTVAISGGSVNGTRIGDTTPAAGAFTTVTASSGFTGNLNGNVTGNVTGSVTGNLTGNVTGNVTASSGVSTFSNVTINGTLNMDAGSTGTIENLSTPTKTGDAATKGYVDTQTATRLALAGGTMSGAVAMGNNKITGLANPTSDQDAATKIYVDNAVQGLDAKASCRVATTASISLSGTQTIDGVAVVSGDRVLVKDQSAPAQNGIYVASTGAWNRAPDADAWAEIVHAYVFVEQGTVGANNGFVCTVTASGTLGTTAVTWVQFSGAGQVIAGTGLTKSGNTLNVNTASSARIVVGADNVDLATTGVVAGTYRSLTVDVYGRATAGSNPTTLSGYGISDAYTNTQADSLLAGKLNLTGGTMSGAIAMGANKITGLADPTSNQDATTKYYVDSALAPNLAATNAYRQQAAASATAAAGSATAAQTAAATAQAIVWNDSTGYPKIRPSLLLDFANSKTVDPRITFARASTASYWDAKGVLRQALAGQPRIDHDPVTGECKGLLIEESRTNLLMYSEHFDNPSGFSYANAISFKNSAISPSGELTMDKMVEDSTNGFHYFNSAPLTLESDTVYTYSIFLKPAEKSWAIVSAINKAGSHIGIYVNISTGVAGTYYTSGGPPVDYVIKKLNNGIVRVSITLNSGSGSDTPFARLFLAQGDGVGSYQGDGKSGVYVGGGQFEKGPFPTSYIPTPATFTSRASEGTYTDSTGLLKTAAINEPRYDHGLVDGVWVPKGLLLEPQRTNLLTYSDNFDNAVWSKFNCTITANSTTAPDGTLTADKIVEASTLGTHYLQQGVSSTIGSLVTFSVFVKAAERSQCVLILFGSSELYRVVFDIAMGSFFVSSGVGRYSITKVGSGWYRCSITATNNGATVFGLVQTASNGTANYQGDGTSGISIWRAQLEEIPAGQSPEPSSPIKTEATAVTRSADISTSSAVTRAADAATLPIGDWHNRYAGTWLVKAAVKSGEPVITAGDITITADTDAEKTYALAYDTAKNAANVQLGKGTFKQVTYYPKKLLTNEIAALQA